MEPRQAVTYLNLYKALVGAAHVMHDGKARTQALLRAWSYYASPLVALLWEQGVDPTSWEVAQHLVSWLLWFQDLEDPESFFRTLYHRSKGQQRLG
jgi:hypothetical protein